MASEYPYNSVYAFQENKLGMGRELEGLELTSVGTHLQRETNKVVASAKKGVNDFLNSTSNWLSSTFADSNFESKPERSNKDVSVSLRSKDGGGNNPTTTGSADDHWNVDGFFAAATASGSPLTGNRLRSFKEIVTGAKDVVAGMGIGAAIVDEATNNGTTPTPEQETTTLTVIKTKNDSDGTWRKVSSSIREKPTTETQAKKDSAKLADKNTIILINRQ